MRKAFSKLIAVIIVLLAYSNDNWGQLNIPEFEHNLVLPDSTFLPPTVPHNAQFDFSITLMHVSSTMYDRPIVVLAYKENKWSVYQWTQQKNSNNMAKRLYNIEAIEVSQTISKNVFDTLISNSLFNMDRKIPNRGNRVTDSNYNYVYIYDGCSYSFIIQAKEKIRIIASSDPDEYYKWNPDNKELKRFIKCRDLMYSLIKR